MLLHAGFLPNGLAMRALTGLSLSAFFWGYLFSQIIGGYLATRFGGKRVLLTSMLLCSAFTGVTPVMVDWFGLKAWRR